MFRTLLRKRLVVSQLVVGLSCLSIFAWSSTAVAETPVILVYGDSLSAAYGIPQQQGWAALLQNKLKDQRYNYQVINASISGETTSGGLSRLNAKLVETKPAIVILGLGGNDGLRGLPIKEMNNNLDAMIQLSKKSGAKVLLLGMKIPPNYGPSYTSAFSQTFLQLSKAYETALVPFMLENVAGKQNLILDDGLHPNVLGQPIILDNLWETLKTLLKK